ncbi:MAG: hypothetical protein Q7N50_11590 [Armatimonadota bacterium]|nr:hypothetical protein [Armatimonadota bacterium]
MRKVVPFLALVLVFAAPGVWAQYTDGVLERCPTLARLSSAGQLDQIRSPVFTDREAAKRFASDCKKVTEELERFSALPQNYVELHGQAALAAEFLTGDVYVLSTSKIESVVKLRESVKIPPPAGFVYVKKYASESSMPPVVRQVFESMTKPGGGHVRGVTIRGRYIALLESEYHGELHDNLVHEMVHAYLVLASNGELPEWFQEASAVYFSIGKEGKLYHKTKDLRVIVDMKMPEEYKNNLHLFRYLEQKVGQEKLYEFIRRAVETGEPDARLALGLKPPAPKDKEPSHSHDSRLIPAALIGAAVLAVVIIVWVTLRREENNW